jgi:hypothetical protein
MIDDRELVAHGNRLLKSSRGAPRQADLRRAISAAYYGIFHCFLRTAADELIGSTAKARKSPSYALIYRSFEHSAMSRLCEEALKSKLPDKLSAGLGRNAFPEEIRYAALAFADLQKLRHEADYNPNARFFKSDALSATVRAAFAITRLAAADAEARRIFLLAMLFKVR